MKQKKRWKLVLLIGVFLLMTLPFVLTFNDVLTKVVKKFVLYAILQEKVVPLEVRLVGMVVRPFGVAYMPLQDGMIANNMEMKMAWNCLGWQSLLLFFGSVLFGLRGGEFTFWSKIQVVVLGLFGIFWVNILRISLIVLLAVYARPIYQMVFHDVFAAVVAILYLLGFWWFSYSFLLEEKEAV